MTKKKIMHIVQSPGGVERYIMMLLKNMNPNHYDHILVCSYDYKKENYKELVEAFEQVNLQRSITLLKDIKAIFKIRKLIKSHSPDIVYMHSSKAGAIGRVANLGIKNVSLYNPHGWAFNMNCGNLKRKIYKSIERALAKICTKVIVISEFEKKSALKNNVCKDNKMKVIFNGIDIKDYYFQKQHYLLTKESLGIPESAYLFGTVGRLTKQKAPDVFVKFAKIIKKEIPESYFIFVGDGEERNKIEELIERENLASCFIITGWVDNPMQYIQLFDQALLLSRWEGFGLVLAEYMLAEKPLIATNVDAIPDLVQDNINGILVPPDDEKAVFEAAMRIYKDEEYQEQLIRSELECVKSRFDILRVVQETEELI